MRFFSHVRDLGVRPTDHWRGNKSNPLVKCLCVLMEELEMVTGETNDLDFPIEIAATSNITSGAA